MPQLVPAVEQTFQAPALCGLVSSCKLNQSEDTNLILWHEFLWSLLSFTDTVVGNILWGSTSLNHCVSWQGENQRLLTTSTCDHAPTALASKPTSAGNSSPLPTSVSFLLNSKPLFLTSTSTASSVLFFISLFFLPPFLIPARRHYSATTHLRLLLLPVIGMSLPRPPQTSTSQLSRVSSSLNCLQQTLWHSLKTAHLQRQPHQRFIPRSHLSHSLCCFWSQRISFSALIILFAALLCFFASMKSRLIIESMHCQFVMLFICLFLENIFSEGKIKMFYFL